MHVCEKGVTTDYVPRKICLHGACGSCTVEQLTVSNCSHALVVVEKRSGYLHSCRLVENIAFPVQL